MREVDSKFKVKITAYGGDKGIEMVEAPLPETFGVTVGSEFSAPFDGNLVNGTLAKVAALQGMAKKTGMSGNKMYSNPEPSEISFELEFEAYYSAKEEVLLPVALLMTMALGTHLTMEDLDASTRRFLGKADNFLGTSSENTYDSVDVASQNTEHWADRISNFIGFIQGPRKVRINFGNTFRLPSVWISSVSPQFSNVLDAEGYPMSATASVTCVLEQEPIVEDVNEWFSGAIGGGVSSRGDIGR